MNEILPLFHCGIRLRLSIDSYLYQADKINQPILTSSGEHNPLIA